MSAVVEFPKKEKERLVWRCNCGCITFFALGDGTIECAHCEIASSDFAGSWRVSLPEPARDVPPVDRDLKVVDMNDAKSAILRVLKRADPEILAALIVMRNDGTMSVWNDRMDTAEHRRWFDGQIDVARKMIFPNDPA